MMLNPIYHCPIWGENYKATGSLDISNEEYIVKRSDRAGGAYKISREVLEDWVRPKRDNWKARLTTWLIDQRAQGDEAPMITTRIVECIDQQPPLPVRERIVRLLRCIASLADTVGDEVIIQPNSSNGNAALAWSESTDYLNEVVTFLQHLQEKGWLEKVPLMGGFFGGTVTVEGYNQIE